MIAPPMPDSLPFRKRPDVDPLHIGFTGTQRGTTAAQRESVARILECSEATDLHHGVCIGADIEIDEIARLMGYRMHLHRATTGDKQAPCECRAGIDTAYDPKPPLVRNKDIVAAADLMVATPGESVEQVRSGTWSTVRLARRRGVPLFLVLPDGQIIATP